MDKIYRRPTHIISDKKSNEKNRKRNNCINFHVTATEKELINARIEASGLKKSDYFIQSCLYQTILVKCNIRTIQKIDKGVEEIKQLLKEGNSIESLDSYHAEFLYMILAIMLKKIDYIKEENKWKEF